MVDFKHRVVTLASRTTPGTQDFTAAGFGTATAWMVTVSGTVSGVVLGVGIAYKPTPITVAQLWSGQAAQNGDTSGIWETDNDAQYEAQALDYTAVGSAEILEADGDVITDGIRLTYDVAPSVALTVRVDLFQCDGAYIDTFTAGAGTNVAVGGTGFEPTMLFLISTNGAAGYGIRWGFGCEGTGGITQCSLAMNSGSNDAPANPHQRINTNHFASALAGAGATNNDWTLVSFDADGFTYSRTNGATPIGFQFLALRVLGVDLWTGALTTPTSNGVATYTDPGFSIGGGWFYPTYAATAGASLTTGGNGTLGHGSVSSSEQYGATTSVQDLSNPLVADSQVSSTSAFLVNDDAGVLQIEGVVASASGGFSINFADTDGTPRYFLALVYAAGDLFEDVSETLSLVDESFGAAHGAIEETLSLSDEVVYFILAAIPAEGGVDGEGGYPGVLTGEGGSAGLEA